MTLRQSSALLLKLIAHRSTRPQANTPVFHHLRGATTLSLSQGDNGRASASLQLPELLALGGGRSTRGLRTLRRVRQRTKESEFLHKPGEDIVSKLHAPQQNNGETSRKNQRPNLSRSQPALRKPGLELPPFIKAKALAKLLKFPVDVVVKALCKRENRKFYYTDPTTGARYVFSQKADIIIPYRAAKEFALRFGDNVVRVTRRKLEPKEGAKRHEPQFGRRQPVILVMGHVDHGKTTLLDTLRQSEHQITSTEFGGITQQINVASAEISPGQRVTFLDTPGHEQFFSMRANCANVGDLCLLVVAADEGCQRQTDESVGWLEGQDLPCIICINKIDLMNETLLKCLPSMLTEDSSQEEPQARANSIEEEEEALFEFKKEGFDADQLEWVRYQMRNFYHLERAPIVPISAKKGLNIDFLKQAIAQSLDSLNIETDFGGPARGNVLELRMVKGRGLQFQVLLTRGTLRIGDYFLAGLTSAQVRNLLDENNRPIDSAVPGQVVNIITAGVNSKTRLDVPLGEPFYVCSKDEADELAELKGLSLVFEAFRMPEMPVENKEEAQKQQLEELKRKKRLTKDERVTLRLSIRDEAFYSDEEEQLEMGEEEDESKALSEEMQEGIKIPCILKSDTAGGLMTLEDAVLELNNIRIVKKGIGNIALSDVELAHDERCPIFGFRVKADNSVLERAAKSKIQIHTSKSLPNLADTIVKRVIPNMADGSQKKNKKKH